MNIKCIAVITLIKVRASQALMLYIGTSWEIKIGK